MFDQDWQNLLDKNMDKRIVKCYINDKSYTRKEIFVIYADGAREVIHTYNSNKYEFTRGEFIGKTKLEAVFYCDRKSSISEMNY